MSFAVSSLVPFPNITFWASVSGCDTLYLDTKEHFQKMTYHNRYCITGSNGMIQLSIPVVGGRNQRAPMDETNIFNDTKWQQQHWRTITSVYKRSPYFEYYERELQLLFSTPYPLLADFNLATLHWLKQQLKLSFAEILTTEYIKQHEGAAYDLRNMKPAQNKNKNNFPSYYQLFSERNGFLPNLSILDLLFSEGPYAMAWINEHRSAILSIVE